MTEVVFRFDTREVEKNLDALGKKAPRVLRQSLNRTATGVKTVMKRAVAKDIGIRVGVAASNMKIRKAGSGRNQATIEVSGKPIPLIQLGARGPRPSRGKGRGVTYRSGGKRKRIRQAFIAEIGGREGVFKRKTRRREPTAELHGPSIQTVFRKRIGEGRRRAHEQFPKEVRQGIRRLMGAA